MTIQEFLYQLHRSPSYFDTLLSTLHQHEDVWLQSLQTFILKPTATQQQLNQILRLSHEFSMPIPPELKLHCVKLLRQSSRTDDEDIFLVNYMRWYSSHKVPLLGEQELVEQAIYPFHGYGYIKVES